MWLSQFWQHQDWTQGTRTLSWGLADSWPFSSESLYFGPLGHFNVELLPSAILILAHRTVVWAETSERKENAEISPEFVAVTELG